MAFSVQMPALGESVTEGTVTRWLKQEGDQVQVDEPLLEVSTDKVDTEIPSPAAGVLSRIVVEEDQTVEVGAELAVIDDGHGGGSVDDRAGADDRGASGDGGAGSEADASLTDYQPDSAEQAAPGKHRPAEPESSLKLADEPPAAQPEQETQPAAAQEPEPAAAPPEQEPANGTPVTMPILGESVTEGTVTRWLKQVGDRVDMDEPLLEVSTDKVDTEIPSPVAGTLLEITVGEDQTVEVGAQLAVIGGNQPTAEPSTQQQPSQAQQEWPAPAPAAVPEQRTEPESPAAEHHAPAQPSASTQVQRTDGQPAGAPYVTPLVRKLAAEHDIDLTTLQGTGVGGRIRKQDVLAAAEAAKQPAAPAEPAAAAQPSAPAPSPVTISPDAAALRGTTQKMSRLRQLIARRMVESLQTSAQLTTVVEVDVTRIARLRERAKRDFETREGVKLSFLPFFAKATVEALKQHPMLNASIDSDTNEVTYHGAEHLGIAVDTERGLLVAVIHDAGDLNIAGLARRIADLAARTRANKITPDDISGGTFTLTNTGSRGALFDTPIINQPQVGILGTGAVVKRPIVVSDDAGGDTIAIRSMCYLALSYDHRLVDGADAARFLTTIKERLEQGAFAADLGL